jgi:hypothetical protein
MVHLGGGTPLSAAAAAGLPKPPRGEGPALRSPIQKASGRVGPVATSSLMEEETIEESRQSGRDGQSYQEGSGDDIMEESGFMQVQSERNVGV